MSGGGDSSGYPPDPNHIIKYAPYVESWHGTWLTLVNNDITAATALNPYTSAVAYVPDTDLDAMIAALNAFCNAILAFHNDALDITAVALAFDKAKTVSDFVPDTALTAHISAAKSSLDTTLLDNTQIIADVAAYADMLDNEVQAKIVPAFQAGMRDINAVISSAFVIGNALIVSEETRNIAKYSADLKLAQWSDRNKALITTSLSLLEVDIKLYAAYISVAEMLGKFFIQGTEYKRLLTTSLIDVLRMKIVAKKEQTDENLKIQTARRKWDLELTQYAASMLGAAGGGHAVNSGTGSTVSGTSVLGGVMAGASIGAMFNGETGGSWGSAIGAAAGGAMAAFG